MSKSNNNIGKNNEEEGEPAIDGHLKTVSNLTNGMNRIAVNHDDTKKQYICQTSSELYTGGSASEDERKAESGSGSGSGNTTSTTINNVVAGSAAAAFGKACAASASASQGGISGDKTKYKQNCEMLESDCDRSQSSISGASWDGNKRGRRSSFRGRAAGKAYAPRWMDQKHQDHRRMASDGNGILDNAVVSFSMIKRKSSSHDNMSEAHHADSASQVYQTDIAHDSHDEGYLSHSTAEGYQSGGYPSYHPALSYAPSVKSDIATVCSGSVVEDIDMEMASVASLERSNTHKTPHHNPKGVEFASNILNDMGPPPLCSAALLLLAANAACLPSSRCSLRSFDTNNDGDAPSDVVAHADTDDCYDNRSIIEGPLSVASTLHSQDDIASEHKEGNLDESAREAIKSDAKNSLHNASVPSSAGSPGANYNLPLQRFRQEQVAVSQRNDGHLLEDSQLLPDGSFSPWRREFDHTREDEWSNSQGHSHSRSPSRSLSPSSR
mmetsp:Transcript_29880/g.63373  ORF Transcript_29880/g.63373 Transcript_29880/m.63373 type:complete len:496 (+) Transcript_29880:114-1601(+)